jgi:hypothetical protein
MGHDIAQAASEIAPAAQHADLGFEVLLVDEKAFAFSRLAAQDESQQLMRQTTKKGQPLLFFRGRPLNLAGKFFRRCELVLKS